MNTILRIGSTFDKFQPRLMVSKRSNYVLRKSLLPDNGVVYCESELAIPWTVPYRKLVVGCCGVGRELAQLVIL